MKINKRINEIFPEIVEIRRDFHMYPEISEKEYRTRDKICEYLEKWDIEHVKGVAETGVVAIIRGKKAGKTLGARADIDALPVSEKNELDFKSVNKGVMHACGHDVHTAIHLGLAKILKEMEEDLKGNVKIFFQPAEETIGGAKRMIKEGHLENPALDYILSLHVAPNVEAGKIQIKYGKTNASTDEFFIRVKGKSGHAAYPETSVDAIVITGHIITALQSLVSRNISPLNSAVLSLGQIKGGRKNNIIAGEVDLSGTLRTLDKETSDFAKKRIRQIVESIAEAYGGKGRVDFQEGYPALINNNEVVDVLNKVGKEVLGKKQVLLKEFPSMGADDFSFFLEKVKGAYYYIGSGNKEKGWTAPLHSGKFMVDEESIKVGLKVQIKTILELLKED